MKNKNKYSKLRAEIAKSKKKLHVANAHLDNVYYQTELEHNRLTKQHNKTTSIAQKLVSKAATEHRKAMLKLDKYKCSVVDRKLRVDPNLVDLFFEVLNKNHIYSSGALDRESKVRVVKEICFMLEEKYYDKNKNPIKSRADSKPS